VQLATLSNAAIVDFRQGFGLALWLIGAFDDEPEEAEVALYVGTVPGGQDALLAGAIIVTSRVFDFPSLIVSQLRKERFYSCCWLLILQAVA